MASGGNNENEPYQGGSEQPSNVVVVPQEKLVFSAPESGEGGQSSARAHLVIHNPTDSSVIYKFKTNANKATVNVSPCVGHIHPGEHADVSVSLNYEDKAALDELKMLVVTAPAPQFDSDLKSLWKTVATENQSVTKVKCVVNQPQQQLANLGDGICSPAQAFAGYAQPPPQPPPCPQPPAQVPCPPPPQQAPPPPPPQKLMVCTPPVQQAPVCPPPQKQVVVCPPPQQVSVCPPAPPPRPQMLSAAPAFETEEFVQRETTATCQPPPMPHIQCVSADVCPSCMPQQATYTERPCVEERTLAPSKICYAKPQQMFQQPCQPPQTQQSVCPPPAPSPCPPPQRQRVCAPAPPPPQPEQVVTCTPPEASFTPPQVSCVPPEASFTPPQVSCVPTLPPSAPTRMMTQPPCPPPQPPPQQCAPAPPPPPAAAETCTVASTQRIPQPMMNFEQGTMEQQQQTCQPCETNMASAVPQPTLYHTVMDNVPQPTSYFVDVTPIAEREKACSAAAAGGAGGDMWSVDRNNILQICLMAAAGIAAAKLFFE